MNSDASGAVAQPTCAICGELATCAQLLPVGHAIQPEEYVHHDCVVASGGEFGFCDVCGEGVAHRENDLRARGEYVECDAHEGEFSSATPEEIADRESLAEYFLDHPPE